MSRNLSTAARQAVNASQTARAFLFLIKLYDPDVSPQFTPLYFVNNPTAITSLGQAYLPFPFRVTLPNDQADGQIRDLTITIDNIDRSIVSVLRQCTNVPWVDLKIVMDTSPDTAEVGPISFSLRNTTYTADTITGNLLYEDLTQLKFPAIDFNPFDCPGLFL